MKTCIDWGKTKRQSSLPPLPFMIKRREMYEKPKKLGTGLPVLSFFGFFCIAASWRAEWTGRLLFFVRLLAFVMVEYDFAHTH